MADTNPSDMRLHQPFVEDGLETDDEKGDSSASKPASNSASKRIRKTSTARGDGPTRQRSASDVGNSDPPPSKIREKQTRQPEGSAARAGAEDEIRSESGTTRSQKSRRHSKAPPPPSPGKLPNRDRPRSPDSRHRERAPTGPCPWVNPLQKDLRSNTYPMQPPHHGPSHPGPPIIRHGLPPPGFVSVGPMPPHGMGPLYPQVGNFHGAHHQPPPHMVPGFAPSPPIMRSDMQPPPHPSIYAPSVVSQPPSLPAVGGPSTRQLPMRPAVHQSARTKISGSGPHLSSKISTYDTSPFSPDDGDHFSARYLPPKAHRVPGGFESDAYSSESPPDSPQYLEQQRRPPLPHHQTTSAVRQIHGRHSRSRSDYPVDPGYNYHHGAPPDAGWDVHSQSSYPGYEAQRHYPGGRRGSNVTTWTDQTSASDPTYSGHVHYQPHESHGGYQGHEYAAQSYMDQARGGPEPRVTAETLKHVSNGPKSTRSNHSHRRSQHSMSEASSRYRGADGSIKLIMPVSQAEGTRIQLGGDMGDREVTLRSTDDPGKVEVTIGTVGGAERSRYLQSASQTSRATTKSSGSTRHAHHSRAEGQEQSREHGERREHRRAPSSRQS
ncbi:hypothetical protein E4T42_00722 [Aureobasidium subglaciale]|nr:hypothetical protein E4T42_00722 [Aureobasidium subglaciale]